MEHTALVVKLNLKPELIMVMHIYLWVELYQSETPAQNADANNNNKKVLFKNCAPFTDCISEINNTERDSTNDVDIVMPMYDLKEYSNNYLKTSWSLWQNYRDELNLDNTDNVVHFIGANYNSRSIKYRQRITGKTNANGRKNVKIMTSLKHLSQFWRTLEMPLITCEMNLILTWSANCVIASNTAASQATTDSKYWLH